MADYQSALTRAVAKLPGTSSAATRRAIYDRAREAMLTRLRALHPLLPESDIMREEEALDQAIGLVETKFDNLSLKTLNHGLITNVSKLNRQLDEMDSGRDDTNRVLKEFEVAMGKEKMTLSKLKSALVDAEEAHRTSVAKLTQELDVMSARSEAAERFLAEARAALGDREAASRELEQRAMKTSLAAQSKESALADLEKELNALRATHADVDVARLAAAERSKALAKMLEDKEVALQRAERTIEALEAKLAEQQKDALGERGMLEEKIPKLTQFEAESAARAGAEGALQSAREDRGARRQEAEAGSNAKDAPSAQDEPLADGTPRSDTRGGTPLKLALAWGFVGIPLVWGIYGTLINAMKLFQ
jgi:chromosome segregation ATPase